MTSYIITKNRGTIPLKNIELGEFVDGSKCIKFDNNHYIAFKTGVDAMNWLVSRAEHLNDWLNNSIPEQAKAWGDGKDAFISRSTDAYKETKALIDSLKVKRI